MDSTAFCYWLMGFMEVENPSMLDERKTQIIKDHLALVFTKVTPDRTEMKPENSNQLFPLLPDDWFSEKICASTETEEKQEDDIKVLFTEEEIPMPKSLPHFCMSNMSNSRSQVFC